METQIIKVKELKSEVISGLRVHLEAATASKAAKMAVRSNMHMETRVNVIADFKS